MGFMPFWQPSTLCFDAVSFTAVCIVENKPSLSPITLTAYNRKKCVDETKLFSTPCLRNDPGDISCTFTRVLPGTLVRNRYS